MPIPRHDFRTPPPDKYGLPGVYYPTNDKSAYVVVVEEVPVGANGYIPRPFYEEHAGTGIDGIAPAILTEDRPSKGDNNARNVRRIYETLPGPITISARIDPEDGSIITEQKRDVRSDMVVALSAGATTTTYEPRGDSKSVSVLKTTTTAYDGVVRSSFTRVTLRLPRVLAGIVVSYNATKGVGDDDSESSGTATKSVRFSASARGSSSLSIIPEVFLPVRDYSDRASSVKATVKQVFLTGSLTEEALLAKLSAVYEVIVTGTAAAGTYLGNSSNVNGVIWFSKESTSRNLKWANGVWSLGTDAEVAAGNYWKRTAAATAWLGTYAPQGTASGTATVGAGRTVNPPFNPSTQEVNLITAGKQVSVSSNAAASKDVQTDGTSYSLSLTKGFSVSTGGSQSRVRVDPTIHGELIIAKPSYTDSVNATAAAVLPAIPTGTSTGISSGFGGDSHAQTLRSYVLPVRRPQTPSTDVPQSGLYILPNYSPSPKDAQYTGVLATIVDYGQLAEPPAEIGYSDPEPTYHQAIAIIPNQPYFLGGTPDSWAISPAIVAGLTFNTSTGVITGSPSIGLTPTVYTVTAMNALGSVTATVTISVEIP